MKQQNCDIVIPLGSGSRFDNWELRMALRSIERHIRHCGRIFIVSPQPPEWLCNVEVIIKGDPYKHNKDANIIEKLLAAAADERLSDDFIFWSDDQVALQDIDCRGLLPVYNSRCRDDFTGSNIWHQRMRNTFDYLAKHGRKLQWNWESHTPQKMNKTLFCQLMSSSDYRIAPGLGVNTLYFGLLNTAPQLLQEHVKYTLERAITLEALPEDKLFSGYNDTALQGNWQYLLEQRFCKRSYFEKY